MNENQRRKERLSEYLSKDILDEDFFNMFSQYLTFMKVVGASRVDARLRFISAPKPTQKCYTILLAALATTTFLISFYFTEEENEMKIILFVNGCESLSYYVCTILYSRFVNNEENVRLYLQMQRVDRLIGTQRHSYLSHVIRRLNQILLWFLVSFFVLVSIPICIDGLNMFLIFFRQAIIPFICFLDISYCSNLTFFFVFRLRFINSIILNYIEGKPVKKRLGFDISLRQTMRQTTAESHDFQTTDLDVYLKELLECFYCFRVLHQLPIAMYITYFFCFFLSYTYYIIFKLKMNEVDIVIKHLIPIFMMSSTLQLILLCVRFEVCFRELKVTKRCVVAVMSHHFEGPLHEKAKRMLKQLEGVPPGFSVYGLWQLDAVFLIQFFNVSSTMLFTLLQLALL